MRRLVTVALIAGVVLLLPALPASALIEGNCEAYFNGIHFDDLDTADEARENLVLEPGDTLTLSGTVGADIDAVYVDVVFRPWTVNLVSFEEDGDDEGGPGTDFSFDLDVDDLSFFGVGIYEFQGRTDICSGNAFFIVGGVDPWETVVGRVAVIIGAIGLFIAATTWLPALFTGRMGWGRAIFGGIFIGLGAAVLAQQAAIAPIGLTSLGVGVLAGTLGAILIAKGSTGVNRLFRRGGSDGESGGSPEQHPPAEPAGTEAGASGQ